MTSSFNLNELENIFGNIRQSESSQETQKSDILKININNDNFTFKTANMFLTLLTLSSLYDVFYNYTKTGIVLFIVNVCLLHFYNMNNNMFNDFDTTSLIETVKDNLNNFNCFASSTSLFFLLKAKYIGGWLFDKLFSKNTQFVLKIIFRIAKSNIVSKYRYYRNTMFNPKLLNETNNEYVYCVPLYLDGVNYKIPIVVDKYKTKNPPLMILNKDEEDITSKLTDYLGPNYDFFGMILKPKHFGEKSLSFMLDDGSETTMDENDLMVL
jgi:hypothetical protein